jgi:transcriptional regulator with XRE-family HTH domain
MPRSVKVSEEFIDQVKAALQRQGYPRQKDLAEELGLSLATVSNFLNGKAVDCLNFQEISDKLGLSWKAIAEVNHNGNSNNNMTVVEHQPPQSDEPSSENFMYVERPPIECICYQTLSQPGALLRVKAPGLMGKTSLMTKILEELVREGYRTVSLNLHFAEITDFTNLDRFLKWFCVSVGQNLGMPNRLADYWDEQFSTSKMNCTAYFEEYLLAASDSPLVLCLDEVERVFPYAVATDFLGLLRAWHEQAKTRKVWNKLRLVVVHSTEVYVPIKVNESPFNVGVSIELPKFTPQQVQNLAQQYGFSWDCNSIQALTNLVGGHPYLLGLAFSYLKINTSITTKQLLETAATEAGIYGNHLRRYWSIVQQDSELIEVLNKVVTATGKVRLEPMQGYKLHSMGLVYLTGNEVTISCNLYRQYFSDRFGVS